ncbi:hypothetical protein [Actinokineospora enzanensis]|uniref:hypothetical protein n=1 Tax=Actinokineospora enzanensis TaxID=155975 RepID=UPI00037C954E|nr:hypothetical protein [Actinokineospora enzanensis]
MTGHVSLVRELKSLRKGRGVLASRIEDRVGPALRAVCAIDTGDSRPVIRRKVTSTLTELADRLPEDLAVAAVAAFALGQEVRQPLYQDRVQWAANEEDCDTRTIRRRVDEAIGHMAEMVDEASATAPPPGWHTAESRIALSLDEPRPELLEQHRVIATSDGLSELDIATTQPTTSLRVLYGGTLTPDGRLVLPALLSRREVHSFAVHAQLSEPPPRMIFIPVRPCTVLDLCVRFAKNNAPSEVRAVRGLSQGEFVETTHHQVDSAGEIHLRFHSLNPGMPYGVQWAT